MTTQESVLYLVRRYPGSTATELQKLDGDHTISALSSVLVKLVNAGKLYRVSGKGPRGGYAYYVDCPFPTRFERL